MIVLKGIKTQIEVQCTAEVDQGMGRTIKVPFVATWQKLGVDETSEVMRQIGAGELDDREIARRYLRNITGMRGEGSPEPIEFSDDLVEEMYKHREYKLALVASFIQAQTGRKALQEKN